MDQLDLQKQAEEQQVLETQQESVQEELSAQQASVLLEETAGSVTAEAMEEAAPQTLKKLCESTEKNMPQTVSETDTSVKEKLREEQARIKEEKRIKEESRGEGETDTQQQENRAKAENAAPKEKKRPKPAGYKEFQEAFWNTTKGFHNKAEVKTAMGVKYAQFDDMDLFALRDALKEDTDRKTDSFIDMYNSVNRLLVLSGTGGKWESKRKGEVTFDFNEVLFTATVQVNAYIKSHSGFRFTSKGDRRVQIALRMQTLLGQLAKERDSLQQKMVAQNARLAEYEHEGLSDEEVIEREEAFHADAATEDLLRLIETNGFASETQDQNAAKNWIEKGYTKDLKALIAAQGVAEADKKRQNEFLAYLMDEENRMVANRVAVSVLLDSSKDATLNMPWLKKELNDHLATKLADQTKEKTPAFVEKAKTEIEIFKIDNQEKIAAYQARLKKAASRLHLPLDATNLYDFTEMRDLITEENEEVFEQKLSSLSEQVHTTDRMIASILKEKYSVRTRASIEVKLVNYFGALRIFGTAEQILDQTASFCDMLKFTAPEEFLEERRIEKVMKGLHIDKVRRDHFVRYMTDNEPRKLFNMSDEKHDAKKKLYVTQMKANGKLFDKHVTEKGKLLTKEQWDALEALHLKSGAMSEEEFAAKLAEVDAQESSEKKFSRKEYLTDREFRDAEQLPERILHAKKELAATEALDSSMDRRFFAHMTAEKDPMVKYRALEAAFIGKTKESKAEAARAEEQKAERTNHVKHILQKNGIPKDKWNEYVEKFSHHITGIEDAGDDLMEDERFALERKNLETYGVKTWTEALEVIELAIPQMLSGNTKEIDDAQERYRAGLEKLAAYGEGKYAEYAELLMEIPEVFAALVNEDAATADAFLKDVLDVRLKSFIDGTKLLEEAGSKYSASYKAIRRQYAYGNLRKIYEGGEGDASYYAEDISNYTDRVFKIKPEGAKTLADNLKAVESTIAKAVYYSDLKGKSLQQNARIIVQNRLYALCESTEDMLKLFDLKELKEFAKEEVKKFASEVSGYAKEDEKTKEKIEQSIQTKFKDKLPATDEALLTKREEIEKEKKKGLKDRGDYLRLDAERLEKIRIGKSLVHVAERGDEETIEEEKADSMRGRLEKLCGAYDLPQVLRDALVEEGSAGVSGGIQSDRKKLQRHALAMSKLYALLTKDYKDDPAMAEEEAAMYILNLYGRPKVRAAWFEKKSDLGPNVAKLRTKKDYLQFRKMYKELVAMESEDSGDADIERERAEISKDLRTVMVTGIGMLDGEGKRIKEFPAESLDEQRVYMDKMIDVTRRGKEYLQRSAAVKRVIRQTVEDEERARNVTVSEQFLNRKTYAVMSYFLSQMMKDLKENKPFDEEEWKARIEKKKKDKVHWENMVFRRDSVSSEDFKKFEENRFETTETEETIAKNLKDCKNSDKDKLKEYEALDEDQKKLFSLALSLLDLGSIGYGTSGTMELLQASAKKAKNVEKIQAALNAYVSGGDLAVDVNYKEAFHKLFSYKEFEEEEEEDEEESSEKKKKTEGEEDSEEIKKKKEQGEDGESSEKKKKTEDEEDSETEKKEKKTKIVPGYVFSEVAFEKAMSFAKQITAKKLAFGEKDWQRLDDGYSSITTAGVKYKKEKQLKEIDSLRGEFLTIEQVREKMLEYIKKDNSFFTRNLNGLKARFEKMTDDDMKLFLRVMQERSVLDVSAADDGSGEELYVDHEKRNALREALSADVDTRASVMKGFDDPEACFRTIVNALSFQIRDDINSTGKVLTEENFVEGALKRKTLADWDLIERAFDFIDEIKEKRTAVYALSHATDFIERSGNEEAISENKKFTEKYAKKEDFKQLDFEAYIREQAVKDEDEDNKRVVAGYYALTDKEKNLFFKVLARRDLLDISKKNYKSNFFGHKDRDYVNQAERDKLIDRYIETSLEDNIGITLDEGAYYDAMHSLFTTQIDDSEKLTGKKDINQLMAAERNLFMLRKTAIDWKLFKRALNFVNRASEELEYAEGNAQLYRGAGNLVDNGRLDMKYSFLRKNFHKTGNQWARRIANIFERNVKEKLKVDGVLDVIVKGVGYADLAARKIGLRKSGSLRKGLAWIKEQGTEIKDFVKAKPKEDRIKINAPEVKKEKDPTPEEKAEAEQAEKERRENLNYYGHIKDGIDNLFAQGIEATDAVADTVDFLREELSETLANHFESMSFLTPTKEVKQKVDKNNIVEKNLAQEKKKEKKEEEEEPEKKYAGASAKGVVKVIQHVGQNLAYGFLNSTFINKEIDEDEDQLEQLKTAAEEYAGEDVEQKVKEMVGEDMAQKILNFENGYYKVKDVIGNYLTKTVTYLNYAKKCVKHVENIASSINNISLLKSGEESAKKKREEDDKKLEEAKETRLDEAQSEKAKNIVEKHRGMTSMSKELGVRLEGFNIAGEVINLAAETASVAGGKLNVGQEAIAKAIQEGLKFALFALQVASDRNVLAQYFLKTDAGKAVVDKTRSGFVKSGDGELVAKLDQSMKTQEKYGSGSFIDILSDARGYEHTSELVENTAMSMAQSIVFCASNYNPMAETRLMAITVMSVMGLDQEIGSTEPATVEKLFNKFSMAR